MFAREASFGVFAPSELFAPSCELLLSCRREQVRGYIYNTMNCKPARWRRALPVRGRYRALPLRARGLWDQSLLSLGYHASCRSRFAYKIQVFTPGCISVFIRTSISSLFSDLHSFAFLPYGRFEGGKLVGQTSSSRIEAGGWGSAEGVLIFVDFDGARHRLRGFG